MGETLLEDHGRGRSSRVCERVRLVVDNMVWGRVLCWCLAQPHSHVHFVYNFVPPSCANEKVNCSLNRAVSGAAARRLQHWQRPLERAARCAAQRFQTNSPRLRRGQPSAPLLASHTRTYSVSTPLSHPTPRSSSSEAARRNHQACFPALFRWAVCRRPCAPLSSPASAS